MGFVHSEAVAMTDGLRDARSKMSRCLRRRACDPRALFPGRVQVREQVREVKSKEPELRVAKARIKVLEADVAVEKAKSRAALAKVKPREVARIERVEVPVERVVEKRVEVPVERVKEVKVEVGVEPSQSELPAHIERDLDRLQGTIPAARAQRIRFKVEEKSEPPRNERHIPGYTADVKPVREIKLEP